MTRHTDPAQILRFPAANWVGGMFATGIAAGLGLMFLGLSGVLILQGEYRIALLAMAALPYWFVMSRYVWRDSNAKRTWRIGMEADSLMLDLPARRCLAQEYPPVHRRVAIGDIEAIETRLEAYRSFGLTNMQQSYALRLTQGEVIVLGEDRALGTSLSAGTVGGHVELVQQRYGLPSCDLGMIEGRGGLLAVLFTSAPPWGVAGLDEATQAARWAGARFTGQLAMLVTLAAVIAAVFL